MIRWVIVREKSSGPRAPCELCEMMIPPSRPRVKIWNSTMKATGGKNGPGLWVHPACADDVIEAFGGSSDSGKQGDLAFEE